MSSTQITAIRGTFVDFTHVVTAAAELPAALRFISDGLLVLENGKVKNFGAYDEIIGTMPSDCLITHYTDKIIMPGFVDTHIHYVQTEMIASYGEQLLEWLAVYTFPTEAQFNDKEYADQIAAFFLQELLKNGTTTALCFGSVHPQSIDSLFSKASELKLRLIAGKVMMDRNAPEELCDVSAEQSYLESKQLIEKWHNKENSRLLYAITPRFAPTSTNKQLELAGKLRREYPDCYVHTHLSENKTEIAWVNLDLFKERNGYLDVYDHYGLTGNKCVFAHCVHLTDSEWGVMAKTDSTISHCPTSNLFLGSGLFPLAKCWDHKVRLGMGTDVGAGTSFCQLKTLNEGYKVQQLQGYKLSSLEAFYHATLGGSHSLSLSDKIGNFNLGMEADFVVLNTKATALQRLRQSRVNKGDIQDSLFALMMLGDDRSIFATYANGAQVYLQKPDAVIVSTETSKSL